MAASVPRHVAILDRLEQLGIRLGLDSTRGILAELGSPERSLRVVLIAGTNGKGSTAAFLQAIATAAGYRTGFYSSPHLETPEERIRIDGHSIAGARLGELLERVVAAGEKANGAPPTYFEALTAAAYAHFAAERVELAIVEVGMGGRLDSTNTADPILSLVTPIALDHREHLGETLAAIAAEKAGIFRPGRHAIAWTEEPEVRAALRRVAAERRALLFFAAERVQIAGIARDDLAGQRVRLRFVDGDRVFETRLLGRHQARNLALAVLAAETLGGFDFPGLDAEASERGARRCRWPGRLEPVALPDGRTVILDGAHNPAGVAAVADFVGELGRPPDLLFGALADKDAEGMLPALAPRVGRITLTAPPSPRALDPRDLALVVAEREVALEPDPERALDHALATTGGTLLVCGSLYLVGDLRAALRRRFGVPPPAADL